MLNNYILITPLKLVRYIKGLTIIFTVFILSVDAYTQVQIGSEILSPYSGQNFGIDVDIDDIGETIIVGAPSIGATVSPGYVQIYSNDNGSWVQQGQILHGEADEDQFGHSVSISGDGQRIAIGAPSNSTGGFKAGRVYIYDYDGTQWILDGQSLTGEAPVDYFGYSVSLSSDGTSLVVGAISNEDGGLTAGQTMLYQLTSNGWVNLYADIDGNTNEFSGWTVAISEFGDKFVSSTGSRLVRAYEIGPNSISQIGSTLSEPAFQSHFGQDLNLSADGLRMVVGDETFSLPWVAAGMARILDFDGTEWMQIGQDILGDSPSDRFGSSISLSGDGALLAVGARGFDLNNLSTGKVSLFKLENGNWVPTGQSIFGTGDNDRLGLSIALSKDGNTLVASSGNLGPNFEANGRVRVFDVSNVSRVSGSNEGVENTSFKIYLNPSSDFLTYDCAKAQKITIQDILGHTVTSESILAGSGRIDLSGLTTGTYFIKSSNSIEKVIIH